MAGAGTFVSGIVFYGLGHVDLAVAGFAASLVLFGVSCSEKLSEFLLPFTGESE